MHLKPAEIGETFDPEYIDRISYFSDDYFLDCDILIIDLTKVYREMDLMAVGQDESHPGWLPDDTYLYIQGKIKQRKTQLADYLNNGGNLFITMPGYTVGNFFMQSPTSDYNTVTIDLMDAIGLDSKDFVLESKKGNNMVFPEDLFREFFQEFSCSYLFSYTSYKGMAIARINNTNHPVAVIISKSKGNVILMPELRINAEDHDDFQFRNSVILKAFQKIDQELKTRYKPIPDISVPEWCSGIYLSNESAQVKKLNKLFEERDKIQLQIAQQQTFLTRYTDLKELLFTGSTTLEERVKNIFVEFGYEILFAEERRDDLIVRYKDDVAVIETKGLKGSAAEANAAQLMKWVTTYHHDHGKLPKGMLVVNPYKDKPLKERSDQAFPAQMLPYCQKMELALLTTTQLLGLYLDFKSNEISLKKIHSLLWNSIGRVEYTPTKIA